MRQCHVERQKDGRVLGRVARAARDPRRRVGHGQSMPEETHVMTVHADFTGQNLIDLGYAREDKGQSLRLRPTCMFLAHANSNVCAFEYINTHLHTVSAVRGVLEAQAERVAMQVGRAHRGDACTARGISC